MSDGNIPIDNNFWQRNQVSQKTNYEKMSVITFYSFRSARFSMPCFPVAVFDRKVVSSHRFDYFLLFLLKFFLIIY